MTNADGWLYACNVKEYKSNIIIWNDYDYNNLRVPTTVPLMIIRPSIGKVYSDEHIDVSIVETNHNYNSSNDDYLVVYEYDGIVLAAIIIDTECDTKF